MDSPTAPKGSLFQKLLRICVVVMVRGATAAGSILLSIVITKYAGLDTLGVFTYLVSVCTMATVFAKGGAGVAYLRSSSRMQISSSPATQKSVLNSVQWKVLRRSLMVALAILPVLFWYVDMDLGRRLLVMGLLSLSVVALSAIAIISEHFKSKSIVDIALLLTPGLISLITAVIVAALCLVGIGGESVDIVFVAWAYTGASVCVVACAFALLLWFENKAKLANSKECGDTSDTAAEIFGEIEKASPHFLSVHLLSFASVNGLFILAAFFFSESELGLIRLSERLAAPVLITLSIINPLIAAPLSQLYARGEIEKLRALVWKTCKICILLTAVLLALSVFGVPYFVSKLELDLNATLPLILIILAGNAVNLVFGPLGVVLSMAKHEQLLKKISLITLVTTYSLCIVLSLLFGTVGFCVAVAASYVIRNLLKYFAYAREIKGEAITPNFSL